MGIFAQQGHAKGDKIKKGINYDLLSGVVLSPKNETCKRCVEYVSELQEANPKTIILFDPQSYILALPEERKEGKLEDYPYYRKMADERFLSNPKNLTTYISDVADFERILGVEDWVSPTLFVHGFDSRQAQIAIQLAYGFLSEVDEGKRAWISLCIDESSFSSVDSMNAFLDDISMLDAHGFYIVIGRNCIQTRPLAYAGDEMLANYLYFCWVLSEVNGYEVTAGYSDLISVPLFAAGVNNVATGWFNGQKVFDEKNFIPAQGGRRPRPRYTSAPLLSPILISPILLGIHNDFGDLDRVLSGTNFDKAILENPDGSSWDDETGCLHNWAVLERLENEIKTARGVRNRINKVHEKIEHALELYEEFEDLPWDPRSSSSHLLSWKNALVRFEEKL